MATRDLEYENNNIAFYEQDNGNGIKCKNYLLCQTVLPMWWFSCKGKYLCTNCDCFGWKELEFRHADNDCVVCYTECDFEMKFPTNCNHWFCVNCCRNILFWDETRYHLSPVPYGCPPCPNNCDNPIKGRQCYCEEYDEVQNQWELSNPLEWKKWNDDDEHYSIETSEEIPGSVYTSKTCPMCRKKYNK